MKKRLFGGLLAAVMVMSMVACSSGNSAESTDTSANAQSETKPVQTDTVAQTEDVTSDSAEEAAEYTVEQLKEMASGISKVGFAIDDVSTDFGSNIVKAVEERCAELGIEVVVKSSECNSNTQISQVENMITADCEAIILKPGDISALEPLSLTCSEAKVPLITLTTPIASDYTASVILDSEAVGAAKAQWLIDTYGTDIKVAMLLGPLSNENGNIMQDSARAVFEKNNVEVTIENIGENKRDKALNVVENWISAGYEFDAIWASNDASALGASTALSDAGITDVAIIGTGGNLEGLQGIKNGDLTATMFTPPFIFGQYGVDLAVEILGGVKVDHDFVLPCIVIDSTNVDEYISYFE